MELAPLGSALCSPRASPPAALHSCGSQRSSSCSSRRTVRSAGCNRHRAAAISSPCSFPRQEVEASGSPSASPARASSAHRDLSEMSVGSRPRGNRWGQQIAAAGSGRSLRAPTSRSQACYTETLGFCDFLSDFKPITSSHLEQAKESALCLNYFPPKSYSSPMEPHIFAY